VNALLKLLPVAAAGLVAAVNSDALKKNLDIISKVQVAAASGVELPGIAEAVAQDFIETKDLPIENFAEFLKENLREKSGKDTRDKSKDQWDTEFRLGVDAARNGFSVRSAGPDKTWQTEDDLSFFYSLTGVVGKGAISPQLVARAQAMAARQAATDSRSASASVSASTMTGPQGALGSNAPLTKSSLANTTKPKATSAQTAEETKRKVVDAQIKRAASGEAQAQYDLANRYITEDGVLKDYTEAKRLLEQAVKNADTQTLRDKAQTQLDKLNKVLGQ
jgi:TPR repeat protein